MHNYISKGCLQLTSRGKTLAWLCDSEPRTQGLWSEDVFKPRGSIPRTNTPNQKWQGRLTHHITLACQGQALALLEDGYHSLGPAIPALAELMPRQWAHSVGPLCILFLINIHSSGHNGPFKAPALNVFERQSAFVYLHVKIHWPPC